ncbi:MAG TPA: nucleotidyltransferase domain-containing protein [Desulfobacteraceae bacterium]|nr:nucleotidyltransferase domain-containing protein [Desulfobacteraceae bacterium]HPJ66551.1 nucleotidyltransferase domain-containing protein [Desulfobacteraceae bacterium]HPQ27483.1 nucleotidyltransferase domain-containing protein [Desulfobacteraceae bacterium]
MSPLEIVQILKDFKKNYASKYGILLIGVFGSVARDEATDKSDVDIVVKTTTPDPFNIVHIKEDLETRLDQHVDIVRLRDNMSPLLLKRIKKEAIYV